MSISLIATIVVLAFLEHPDVDDIPGYCERNEDHYSVPVGECLAFSGAGFYGHVLQKEINFLSRHSKYIYNFL